jgi:hypothetical protein
MRYKTSKETEYRVFGKSEHTCLITCRWLEILLIRLGKQGTI